MQTRALIHYALARRARLADVAAGRLSRHEVCDAHPYLLRAARFHGEPGAAHCPICARGPLAEVTYAFGDSLGDASGRARAAAELVELAATHPEVSCHVVEVCLACSWNFRVSSFVVGSAVPDQPARPVRRRTAHR